MKCNLRKFLIFVICLSAIGSLLHAKSYTTLHNQGSSVLWQGDFPEEVIGVKLTVKYQPLSELQDSVVHTQYFAVDEAIVYPFDSGGGAPVVKNGTYKWELSLIVGGMNLVEPIVSSEEAEIEYDENGRIRQQFAGVESLKNAHRNIDASAKVTSGRFMVRNGSVLDFNKSEIEALHENNK